MIERGREGTRGKEPAGATGGEMKVCHSKVKKLISVGNGRALSLTQFCKTFG